MSPLFANFAWVAMAVGWYVLRVPHDRRSKKTAIAHDGMDRAEIVRLVISFTGMGIIPIVYIISGFPAFANRAHLPWVALAGVAVAGAALIMFHLTHSALGKNWSVSLQTREEHKLITNGIYARIRHPMYTAFWLWAIAQFLLLPNWIAGMSGLIGFGALYFLRVGPEEQMMADRFGEEYTRYMQRTGRVLPKF